jgi:hypothetical protein
MTIALALAAAAVALWPMRAAALPFRLPAPVVPSPAHAGYADAIQALSVVRGRLLATELLGDKERAAVDALTLALVNGSDRV